MRKSSFCLALISCVWAAPFAAAAGIDDNVPGRSGLTYFDLMKLVVTDLDRNDKGDAVGSELVPFTHIAGEKSKSDPLETIELGSLEVMTIPDDSSRIILLADLGRADGMVTDTVVLALFSLAPKPKLLDVAEVGSDRSISLRTKTPDLLAPRTPLVLVESSHGNSNQTYAATEIIFVRDDRFKLIDSVFTLGDRACTYNRTQESSFSTRSAVGPYREIDVAVKDRTVLTGEDCGEEKPPRPRVSTFKATYIWDEQKQRFTTRSKQLDLLAKMNLKRV